MPRYRKLHVKTVESLDINDMPDDFTRLLWVLLPLALCREGRGIHNPAWLKSKLFPLRTDINQDNISTAFDWLIKRGMVVPYSVNGRSYFHVPTFHKYQGTTTKEAESDYPPPPELGSTEVQTNSRPTPELVQSKSVTDAVFNIQYSDPNTGTANAVPSAPATFDQWQKQIEKPPKGSNRSAQLRAMFEHLYPGRDPPDFGYIGQVARKVGGAGRLAELLWKASTRPPSGDILAYCQAVAKGESNGAHKQKTIVLDGPDGPYIPSAADPSEFYGPDG